MPESVESMPATDNDAGGLPEESNESESLSVADVAAEGISVMLGDAYAEGAVDGKERAQNGCGWKRPQDTMRDEEKGIYNAGTFSADTMYCHHFNTAGEHLVLHQLSS